MTTTEINLERSDAAPAPPEYSSDSPAKTIRVLYIDYSLGFGGSFKSLALVLRGLPMVSGIFASAQDPALVHHWFPGVSMLRFRRLINYRTKARLTDGSRRRWVRSVLNQLVSVADGVVTCVNAVRLAVVARLRRIDLIHMNNAWMPPEGVIAARLVGIPCIAHLRGYAMRGNSWRLIPHSAITHVISVSNSCVESLVHTPIPDVPVTTIYDPVELEGVDRAASERDRIRAECGIAPDEIAVGLFGRIVAWKGQLEFVRAAVGAMMVNPKIRPVLVGDVSDAEYAYVRSVRREIAASGYGDRFILTGYRANVDDYFAAMDIVAHASIEPEPFGMVVPEAMAARRAVIATKAGGPVEVIDDGIDGMLVPMGDVGAMQRAILDLASDADRREMMGAAARAKVEARLTVPAIAGQLADLYERILAERAQVNERTR